MTKLGSRELGNSSISPVIYLYNEIVNTNLILDLLIIHGPAKFGFEWTMLQISKTRGRGATIPQTMRCPNTQLQAKVISKIQFYRVDGVIACSRHLNLDISSKEIYFVFVRKPWLVRLDRGRDLAATGANYLAVRVDYIFESEHPRPRIIWFMQGALE